LKALHKRECH